jgi:hypothetical protein
MDSQPPTRSAQLLAGQQQLEERRQAHRQMLAAAGELAPLREAAQPLPAGPAPLSLVQRGQALLLLRRQQEAASQPQPSDALKAYRPPPPPSPWTVHFSAPQTPAAPPSESGRPAALKVYPGILLAMLDRGLEAAGRIWLLLQYLDEQGSGRITIEAARQQLTGPDSALRVCSWRNLRGLLQRGENIFWQRDEYGRIWLRGAGKVAASLATGRLQGRPVELPLAALLGGVGGVRAHFYASFHSGRPSSNPISRATLAKLTHGPGRTQRSYERTAGVRRRPNVVIGEPATRESMQERAWQHGRATFTYCDHQGQQGQPGLAYIAWRLPNSYAGCHTQRPKGRQKKINRQIDLVTSGAQGNGRPVCRLFYASGAAAAKAYNRTAGQDAYWRPVQPATSFRRWHVLNVL